MDMLTLERDTGLNQTDRRFLRFKNYRGINRDSWFHNRGSSVVQGNLFWFFIKPKLEIHYDINDNLEEEDKRWGTITDYGVIRAWEKKEQDPSTIDMYEGIKRMLPPVFYPNRRFINVGVHNDGRAVARNCEVKLKFLEALDGCDVSTKNKSLVWENGRSTLDIGVKSKKVFHLGFSQQRLTEDQDREISTVDCKIEQRKVEPQAWIGTVRALEN